jgi:6-phosphogluconate dehydrogenase
VGEHILLNMADHGFSVAGYDKAPAKVVALGQEANHRDARGASVIQQFIAMLRGSRAIMMLVPVAFVGCLGQIQLWP